jgi:predicted Zn-dependent peptidase
VVWPGDRSRRWDRTASEALLYLLGETGYAGRLGRALVEPGLVYSVEATLEEAGAPGFLMIRTAAAPEHTPEVLRRIRQVVESAAEGGFRQAELQEALAYRRGKATRSREGALALADTLLAESSWTHAKEDVDLARLNDTARRLLRNGGPLALVAGPGARGAPAHSAID